MTELTRLSAPLDPEAVRTLENYTPENEKWFRKPRTRIQSIPFAEALREQTEVVLITAAPVERDAVLGRLRPAEGHSRVVRIVKDHDTYFWGQLGAYHTALTMCTTMGSDAPGASQATASDAIDLWGPQSVILVGIAFGRETPGRRIADVLISTSIIPYESERVGDDRILRTERPAPGQRLLNRFKNVIGWRFLRPDGTVPALVFGAILTGQKLVDDEEFRDALFEQSPESVGGEMEAAGTYAACVRKGVEWIVVKAIADWGAGKTKKHQPLAAAAAVSLVETVLSDPHALTGIPSRFGKEPELAATTTAQADGRLQSETPHEQPSTGNLRTHATHSANGVASVSNRMRLALPSEERESRSLPIDIGTAWGLPRSTFIGMLRGGEKGTLHSLLNDAERVLSEAVRAHPYPPPLPGREWVQLGPGDLAEAGNAAWTRQGRATATPNSLKGFLVELEQHELSERTSEALLVGCTRLMSPRRDHAQVATVLHVPSDVPRAEGWLKALERKLAQALQVPIETLRVLGGDMGQTAEDARPAVQVNSRQRELALAWCDEEERRMEAPETRTEWNGSPEARSFSRLRSRLGGEAEPGGRSVIAELDAEFQVEKTAADREFLAFVGQHAPSELHDLVRAYAGSARAGARREALIFATRADTLIESWIDGADLDSPSLSDPRFWIADRDAGTFVDDFATAVVRRARTNFMREGAHAVLCGLHDFLSPEALSVVRAWENDDPVFSDPRTLGEGVLAIRSGARFVSGNPVDRAPLEPEGPWYFLLAQPPDAGVLGQLLGADSRRRAVLGLCTPEEWRELWSDPNLARKILACRRDRPLHFAE
jgi:nucleoside phosphorylase